MIRIQASMTINRPIEEVFRFMTNHQNALQWQAGLLEARVTNDVVGVGKTWVDVVQVLGRRIEIASELTEFEPLRRVGFKSTSGPIPIEGRYSYEQEGQGTKVTFTMQGEAGGFFKLAEPIVARATQRQWETNLANLKDLLEQRDAE
jgi:uncharacterized protein YndB with AHSA1/START domain